MKLAYTRILLTLMMVCVPAVLRAQDPVVTIHVDAGSSEGPMKPVWSYFGYDEPNYTYMTHGRELLSELGQLNLAPVYIRTHSLLSSGDGTPALKWGSTNAYTEEASGKPKYDWNILDKIFDAYMHAGVRPFVEIGFMPEALSIHPQPYQHTWPQGAIDTGWSYPPKDYTKWRELIRQWVLHSVERYGQAEVASWYWEVWNEPDIFYWHGTPEEYDKLYDYAMDAVKSALPAAHVGGPAVTGPGAPRAAEYLRQFLEHCARGTNYATGKTGAPLDFISYHAKGAPEVVEGHVRMGLAANLRSVAKGLEVVSSFPQFAKLPIILSESDPEGCAACSVRTYPQNAYRNGALYPAFTAAALKGTLTLADQSKSNMEGMLTWAFEFEGQPYFDGLRTLATNGIDKPVLNLFRMENMLRGERLRVESSGAVGVAAILAAGVRQHPDIDALAARSEHSIAVLVWNYHDDDVPAPDAPVHLLLSKVSANVSRVLLHHYRIDSRHSNAYTVWKEMGSPQNPTEEQVARLKATGQLQLLEPPRWLRSENGKMELDFRLPRQGVSLLEFTW